MASDFIQLARLDPLLPGIVEGGPIDVLGVRHQAAIADAGEQIRSLTHVKAMTIEPVHQPLWL